MKYNIMLSCSCTLIMLRQVKSLHLIKIELVNIKAIQNLPGQEGRRENV